MSELATHDYAGPTAGAVPATGPIPINSASAAAAGGSGEMYMEACSSWPLVASGLDNDVHVPIQVIRRLSNVPYFPPPIADPVDIPPPHLPPSLVPPPYGLPPASTDTGTTPTPTQAAPSSHYMTASSSLSDGVGSLFNHASMIPTPSGTISASAYTWRSVGAEDRTPSLSELPGPGSFFSHSNPGSMGCLSRDSLEPVTLEMPCRMISPPEAPWRKRGSKAAAAAEANYVATSGAPQLPPIHSIMDSKSGAGAAAVARTEVPATLAISDMTLSVTPSNGGLGLSFPLQTTRVFLNTPGCDIDQLNPPFKVYLESASAKALLALDSLVLFVDAVRRVNRRIRIQRREREHDAARSIQSVWRGHCERRTLRHQSRAATLIQSYARRWLALRQTARLRAAADRAQSDREHRERVVNEVVTTEESYVRNLDVLVRVYWRPLRSLFGAVPAAGRNAITAASIEMIFGNVEAIYERHAAFYEELVAVAGPPVASTPLGGMDSAAAAASLARDEDSVVAGSPQQLAPPVTPAKSLGQLFIEMTRWLDIYVPYCVNYHDSKAELDRCCRVAMFAEYLQNVKALKESHKNDLAAFLIVPVQRIPRYELLLKDIIRHTEPTHPDLAHLQQALAGIRHAAKRVNRAKMYHDSKSYISDLAGKLHRGLGAAGAHPTDLKHYVGEGLATYSTSRSPKPLPVYLFLFTDQLVVMLIRGGAGLAGASGGGGGGGVGGGGGPPPLHRSGSYHTTGGYAGGGPGAGPAGAGGVPKGAKLEFLVSVPLDAAQVMDLDSLLHPPPAAISSTSPTATGSRGSSSTDARYRKGSASTTGSTVSSLVPSPQQQPLSWFGGGSSSSKDRDRDRDTSPVALSASSSSSVRREHAFMIVESAVVGVTSPDSTTSGTAPTSTSSWLGVPAPTSPDLSPSTAASAASATATCHKFVVDSRDAKARWLENLAECRDAIEQRRDIAGILKMGGSGAGSSLMAATASASITAPLGLGLAGTVPVGPPIPLAAPTAAPAAASLEPPTANGSSASRTLGRSTSPQPLPDRAGSVLLAPPGSTTPALQRERLFGGRSSNARIHRSVGDLFSSVALESSTAGDGAAGSGSDGESTSTTSLRGRCGSSVSSRLLRKPGPPIGSGGVGYQRNAMATSSAMALDAGGGSESGSSLEKKAANAAANAVTHSDEVLGGTGGSQDKKGKKKKDKDKDRVKRADAADKPVRQRSLGNLMASMFGGKDGASSGGGGAV
ncbi:hypothetical protein H9P43_007816 [Blastocladiella emersonii ATCC 22665]|nr:hypothetical protein H9P43_007816 [Blastocladiella emersonii ATCC 22665]